MKSAFTLVELLVVVAISSILVTILTFSISDALIRTRIAASKNNMKALANGIQMLRMEKGVLLVDYGQGYEKWGKDRIVNLFHGVGLGDPRMGRSYLDVYAPLTSPVSYMSQIPKDPFITEKIIELYYKSREYHPKRDEYLYFASCEYPALRDSWCDAWAPPGGHYTLEGCGPVSHSGGCNWYLTKYNPSNGLLSRGSLYYSNTRGFSL